MYIKECTFPLLFVFIECRHSHRLRWQREIQCTTTGAHGLLVAKCWLSEGKNIICVKGSSKVGQTLTLSVTKSQASLDVLLFFLCPLLDGCLGTAAASFTDGGLADSGLGTCCYLAVRESQSSAPSNNDQCSSRTMSPCYQTEKSNLIHGTKWRLLPLVNCSFMYLVHWVYVLIN